MHYAYLIPQIININTYYLCPKFSENQSKYCLENHKLCKIKKGTFTFIYLLSLSLFCFLFYPMKRI